MFYVCRICRKKRSHHGACIHCGSISRPRATLGGCDGESVPQDKVEEPLKVFDSDKIARIDEERISTGIRGLDDVLGGGFIPGFSALITGDRGIGKSTLLTQVAGKSPWEVLYFLGEESAAQAGTRAKRLGLRSVKLAEETDVTRIVRAVLEHEAAIVIVDSAQTLRDPSRGPGPITQLVGACKTLIADAKKNGYALLLVGHVTKKKEAAGPKAIAHFVDVELEFKGISEQTLRTLTTPKNRGGPTDVSAKFHMTARGLVEVGEKRVTYGPESRKVGSKGKRGETRDRGARGARRVAALEVEERSSGRQAAHQGMGNRTRGRTRGASKIRNVVKKGTK